MRLRCLFPIPKTNDTPNYTPQLLVVQAKAAGSLFAI